MTTDADEMSVIGFLTALNHPRLDEINALRSIIIEAHPVLKENIKWKAPNFCLNEEDRITLRINPPKFLQVIFHRGAKVLEMPTERLIQDDTGLLKWATNDRTVMSFENMEDIEQKSEDLKRIVLLWLRATS